jgi:DNA-directed RNA polymerase specialized sigma24 family protein
MSRKLVALRELTRDEGEVVELRYFGGLSVEETATVLGASDDTITRDWRTAKAFLCRELS